MRISRSLVDDMVDHARAEAPNECCGMLAAQDGRTVAVHRARNFDPRTGAGPSPLRFVVHPEDVFRITTEIEDAGQDLIIYHSHTRTEPRPSQTDINFADNWPDAIQIIVGVRDPEADVRAWTIGGGQVSEVELIVE